MYGFFSIACLPVWKGCHFRMWLSLSALFSLFCDPRFSTKDDQNTVSVEMYSARETPLSKQVTGLYCGLRLTGVNWSQAEWVCMERVGNKFRWTHCACQGSHLVQTQKAWCAPGLFSAEVSWAGWLRFICIYTLATFLISDSTFFCRTDRKMASSETGKWEKYFFLILAVLFLKSVKLISNLGTGWWVLEAFLASVKKLPAFYFFALHFC